MPRRRWILDRVIDREARNPPCPSPRKARAMPLGREAVYGPSAARTQFSPPFTFISQSLCSDFLRSARLRSSEGRRSSPQSFASRRLPAVVRGSRTRCWTLNLHGESSRAVVLNGPKCLAKVRAIAWFASLWYKHGNWVFEAGCLHPGVARGEDASAPFLFPATF
jgi:hypothetical protein